MSWRKTSSADPTHAVAHLLFDLFHAFELDARGAARLGQRHAAGDEPVHHHGKARVHFFGEFGFKAAAAKQVVEQVSQAV